MFPSCGAAIAFGPLSVSGVQQKMVQGSLSRAWQLGQAVLDAQCRKLNPVDAILANETGKVIITGKVNSRVICLQSKTGTDPRFEGTHLLTFTVTSLLTFGDYLLAT